MNVRRFLVFALLSVSVLSCAPMISVAAPKAASAAWPAPKIPGAIRALQYLLRSHGFTVKVDGKFGQQTRRQVANFQQSRRLKVDGVVGAQTWRALIVRAKKGDKGDAVRAVQTLCFSEVHDVRLNGIFDESTEDWIKDVQKYESLKVDGIVGPYTWKRLLQSQSENPYD
jgi:peptidoglycan hydrolase-like protein with peptidoglycan-binding domain